MVVKREKAIKHQPLFVQEDKVFGWKQHLHHRGFLQKSQGQKNRAAEVYEEDEEEVDNYYPSFS